MSSPPIDIVNSDTQRLRRCLGKFATGVTVVTCSNAEGVPHGITANSFSSVSLEPPLILWSIAKASKSLGVFLSADHFAVNILANSQLSLSSHFARTNQALFANVDFESSSRGVPILLGTVACLECHANEQHDCGDHQIIIGEIERYRVDDLAPLLFFGGRYVDMN